MCSPEGAKAYSPGWSEAQPGVTMAAAMLNPEGVTECYNQTFAASRGRAVRALLRSANRKWSSCCPTSRTGRRIIDAQRSKKSSCRCSGRITSPLACSIFGRRCFRRPLRGLGLGVVPMSPGCAALHPGLDSAAPLGRDRARRPHGLHRPTNARTKARQSEPHTVGG